MRIVHAGQNKDEYKRIIVIKNIIETGKKEMAPSRSVH